MEFSNLSRIISPTLSRQLFMMAKQYDDVIDFTLGDPDIPTPRPICEAAARAIAEGCTHYSPNAGLPALREAIAGWMSEEKGRKYGPENVLVTVGATQAVYLSLMSCINPGDEVLILAPYWVQYENIVRLLGGKPVIIDKFCEGFEPDLLSIKSAINCSTKAIVVNSPNNPSGYVYKESFLKELAALARINHFLIVDDETYSSLAYDGKIPSIAEYARKEELILINSFSKQFAMAGWRVGYVAADERMVQVATKFQQNMAVCVATPNQYAALEALRGADEYSLCVRNVFSRRRDTLMNLLETIPELTCLRPEGTFYAFVDISRTGMDSLALCYGLLEKEHVAVIPGVAFGGAFDHYVRLAFTLEESRIAEGINRIQHFLSYKNV